MSQDSLAEPGATETIGVFGDFDHTSREGPVAKEAPPSLSYYFRVLGLIARSVLLR